MIIEASMTKISLEIDEDLNRQLKQYALDKYGRTHGKQQMIIRDALVAYLKDMSKPAKTVVKEVESTVEEVPQEPIKAKAKPKGKRGRPPKKGRRGEFGNDAAAVAKVKELWEGGERNVSKIASLFPKYTPRQVEYWINKNLSKEVLSTTS
jgi:mRNA-degrading endonuclease RelE of RelBE toxin-antitoxin system